MTNVNKWDCYTYSGAADMLGVAVWRLRYAVDSGYLPGPGVVFKRRALFAPSQIAWMRAHFACAEAASCRSRVGGFGHNRPSSAVGIDSMTAVSETSAPGELPTCASGSPPVTLAGDCSVL